MSDGARLEAAFRLAVREMETKGFRYPRESFMGDTFLNGTSTNFMSEATGYGIRPKYKVCYEQVEYVNERLEQMLPDIAKRYDFVMEDNQGARGDDAWIPGHYWGAAVPKNGKGASFRYDPRANHFGGSGSQYSNVVPFLDVELGPSDPADRWKAV